MKYFNIFEHILIYICIIVLFLFVMRLSNQLNYQKETLLNTNIALVSLINQFDENVNVTNDNNEIIKKILYELIEENNKDKK